MTKYHSLCLFLFFIHFIFILIHLLSCCDSNNSSSNNNNVTELVNEVCAKTSNYSFCIESLYSDPHTSQYDQHGLAHVAFNLAYINATGTREYIAKLQENHENSSTLDQIMILQKCAENNEEAVTAIANAIFDLDSDTFFELAELAGVASNDAEDCQDAIIKGKHYSQLEFMNNDLKGLCEICVVISNLFTGGAFYM